MSTFNAKLNSSQLSPKEPLYASRSPFLSPYATQPNLVDVQRWRLVAAEPINKLCRRTIQREVSSLNWKIVPIKEDDEDQKQAAIYYTDLFKDFRELTVRTLKTVCEIPQGGAWEIGWIKPGIFGEGDKGTPSFVKYIDGGTLHPTINEEYPIIQIDPKNTQRRVLFADGEINRIVAYPYDEFDRLWWQESPTMAAYLPIEALSRIYIYYLKQLHDTPPAGILDLMDFSEDHARSWATNFREMLEGIDPIKIPILYEHDQPAKWLPIGQSPAELNIPTQFKQFAEMVAGHYGLSLDDLRMFNDGNTKTGSAVNRRITIGSGINFFAELIKDSVQKLLPNYLLFVYDDSDIDAARTDAQIRAANARTIQTLDWMLPKDKAKQAIKDGVVTVDLDLDEIEKQSNLMNTGMSGLPSPRPGQLVKREGRTTNTLLEDAKANAVTTPDLFTKAELEPDTPKKIKTAKKFKALLAKEFKKIGRKVKPSLIEKLLEVVKTQLQALNELDTESMKAKAEDDDDPLKELKDRMFELLDEVFDTLVESLLDLDTDVADVLIDLYVASYEEGMREVAQLVQDSLYRRGIISSPRLDIEFNVTNKEVLKLLEDYALDAVVNINNGTKYYFKQLLIKYAIQGLNADTIAENIKQDLFGLGELTEEGGKLSDSRIRSIVNTELNKADSTGRLGEMEAIGLKLKTWLTRIIDVCALCLRNEAQGSVPLDFEYESVFGPTLTTPGHPSTCHCTIGADEEELESIGTTPEYWKGN